VSLPPHAVPIKFIANDDPAILWANPDMPPLSPGAPTLLDPSLEASATSEDDDDKGFGWQT